MEEFQKRVAASEFSGSAAMEKWENENFLEELKVLLRVCVCAGALCAVYHPM